MEKIILLVFSLISLGKYGTQDCFQCAPFNQFEWKFSVYWKFRRKLRFSQNFLNLLIFRDSHDKVLFNNSFISSASCADFVVLSSPKSIKFEGSSDLPSSAISEVFAGKEKIKIFCIWRNFHQYFLICSISRLLCVLNRAMDWSHYA